MTVDQSLPPRPGASGDASRRRLPAAAGVLAVLAAATLAGCGDATDAAEDPGGGSSTTQTSSPSTPSASSSPSASESGGSSIVSDPVPSPLIDNAVRAALDAGFPALVPTGLPEGWSAVSAAYDAADGGVWQIMLTAPGGGAVSLRQSSADLATQLLELPEVRPAGGVAISGTGRWKAYSASGIAVLAKQLSGTSAVVVGPDQDTVVAFADLLLTAEDSGNGTGDG